MNFRPQVCIRAVWLVVVVLLGLGCAIFKKKEQAPLARDVQPAVVVRPGPLRVGTITLVNEAEHFVLIDTELAALPAIGTALKSFTGDAASGVVAVGNVNRRPFVVADIVQGAPKKGDGVFQ